MQDNDFVLFASNTALNIGAAIFMQADDMEFSVVVEDSELSFINNFADAWAGGLYVRGSKNSTTKFSNSIIRFIANKACSGSNAAASGGGMTVSFDGTTALFENSVVLFTSNVAGGRGIDNGGGGGLYTFTEPNLTVPFTGSYVNFTSNTALGIGGGIRAMSGAGNMLTISHSTAVFLYNTALSSGGAISAEANLEINNSNIIFDHNWAQHGRAVYARGDVSFIDSNILFSSNTATRTQYVDNAGSAGAMFVDVEGNVSISGGIVNFFLNRGYWNGGEDSGTGALFLYNGGSLNVRNGATVIFTSNAVGNLNTTDNNSRGGVLKILTGSISVYNSTLSFFHNYAPGSGGATFISGNNYTGTYDHFRTEYAYLYFENNISGVNVADNGGGAFGVSIAGRVSVINSTFIAKNNTSMDSGGAIYQHQPSNNNNANSSVTFYGSLVVFENNEALGTADGDGGSYKTEPFL